MLSVALVVAACAPRAVVRPEPSAPPPPAARAAPPELAAPAEPAEPEPVASLDLTPVLEAARAHVGGRRVAVGGRSYPADCSNFVRAMFLTAGIDLWDGGFEGGENGVAAIHRFVERHGTLHRGPPQPGDVVFFDDTYDKNRNGRIDDPLSHAGVVDQVDEDGLVWVIHLASRGVVRDPMHVGRPADARDEAGRAINTWLRVRRARDPPGTRYLTGALFAGYGRLGARPRVASREE